MIDRVFRNYLRGQLGASFISIDGLMLRAMIAKEAFYIWHETYRPDITNQQNQPHHTFQQIIQPGIPTEITFSKSANTRGQQEKQSNANREGYTQRKIKSRALELFIFACLCVGRKGES